MSAVSWWLTQAQVFWMYLRLVVWPWPLVIHYELPYLQSLTAAWPWLLATAGVAISTALALWRNSATGFVWTCVFALLAPMWIVPIVTEVAAERRMYLPLAAILAWAIGGGVHALVGATRPAQRRSRMTAVGAAALALMLVFAAVSTRRLEAYRSPLTLWQDTVAHQPDNALARNNLAIALADAGQTAAAVEHYRAAIELTPRDPKLYFNRGNLIARNRPGDAVALFEDALRHWPEYPEAHNNLGSVLVRTGQLDRAIVHFERAVEFAPDYAEARYNLEQARRAGGALSSNGAGAARTARRCARMPTADHSSTGCTRSVGRTTRSEHPRTSGTAAAWRPGAGGAPTRAALRARTSARRRRRRGRILLRRYGDGRAVVRVRRGANSHDPTLSTKFTRQLGSQ